MKLWDKGISTHKKIDRFTVGNDRELDLILVKYDILASKAHANMLGKTGLLSEKEARELIAALDVIAKTTEDGKFTIEEDFEDMHSKIEYMLTEMLGVTGKKIHMARSRNDQVLVAMQLYVKEALSAIEKSTALLFNRLLELAEKHKDILMPGYTHLQIAMPSSFGLWFSAYAECLIDDLHLLKAAFKVADQNPLGSAAGYGSSFPINRELTTEELGFATMKYNVIAAQMSRGKMEKTTAFAISSIAGTLSKLAMDICLYMGQNFDFISFPDEITTGSSIMPHKKNPDVFELIRAKCNRLQALPNELNLLTTNLPSGYHRDLQLAKEIIIPGIENLKACLEITCFSLENIEVTKNILQNSLYDPIFSVEVVNEMVEKGIPFREAYQQVGKTINNGTFIPKKQVQHTHQGSIGNLCLKEIQKKMENVISL
ncbi:argininosuccinate lyase [Ascidiimonas aurantiaca]|uniref:argininosuccinate lyase n=1 Tax=Ascidiimonas aurantiaca TaxID=1685432 RepID=UPI0030EC9802